MANQKRSINDELELIPARIDEVQRNLPEQEDWDSLLQDVHGVETELAGVEEAITDRSKAYEAAYTTQTSCSERNKS